MTKPSRVIVLAEDKRQQNFVRRYLERAGFPQRQIHFEDLPSGKRAGEQWVRQQYAKNVDAYRTRARNAETALVVVIDADVSTVDTHHRELSQALIENEFKIRADNEKIVHLIPKRNIETWILCLIGRRVDGQHVNEDSNYRHESGIDEQIKPAALQFFEWSRKNAGIPAHCVPSLRAAIPEVRRLEQ